MKQQLADIATNESKKLNGFKVLGVFPFHLKYITTGTHIRLCAIKEELQTFGDKEPIKQDFYDLELQKSITPLILEYILTALINGRPGGFIFKPLIRRKLNRCGHSHILNLYATIQQLNEPAFFLTYWNWMKMKDNTLLREEKPSLEESSGTKKKQD